MNQQAENQPSQPSPPVSEDVQAFDISDRVKKPSAKEILSRPATIGAIVIGVAIACFVVYLEFGSDSTSLPVPEASYTLLPNEGRTDGVPIAIKLNQIAIFTIDDPLTGAEGAARAKALVDRLQNMVSDLRGNPGKAITYITDAGPLPAIVLQDPDGTNRRSLVQLTEADVTLSGGADGKRVARIWAERLTDSLKVLAFGEAPEFSTGTEFGDALETLYASARAAEGIISRASLDEAFETLTDSQRLALETVPQLASAQSLAQ